MELGVTFPFQRQLKTGPLPQGEAPKPFCWDLHHIFLRGRPCLLAVHCSSRYTVAALDPPTLTPRELPAFAWEQIRRGLGEAGLGRGPIDVYLALAGAPRLSRTHGRREVAFLNRAWGDILALDHLTDFSRLGQPLLEEAVNRRPCHAAGHEGWGRPVDFLKQEAAGWAPPALF